MAKKSLVAKANRKPKFAVRAYNRCRRCGRPRAYLRKFGMCRLCVRQLAHRGVPASKLKEEVAKILIAEGFINGYETVGEGVHRMLRLKLRYTADREKALHGVRRVSKPGLRVYRKAGELPRVNGGLGVAIVSTSQGLLPDREARRRRLGGEILCEVW